MESLGWDPIFITPTGRPRTATGDRQQKPAQLALTLQTLRSLGCLWFAFEYVRDLRCMPCGRAASRPNIESHQLCGDVAQAHNTACLYALNRWQYACGYIIRYCYLCRCAFSTCVRKAWIA
jgi:hypothetical protein